MKSSSRGPSALGSKKVVSPAPASPAFRSPAGRSPSSTRSGKWAGVETEASRAERRGG